MAWDGWESILERPVFADLGREVRFRSGPRAADGARGRAVGPRRGAGARPSLPGEGNTAAQEAAACQCPCSPSKQATSQREQTWALDLWMSLSAAVRPRVSGSRILSPPDTSLPCEYASESSPSKKLLCPKHGFASVVVVGTSASTKSLLCNSGHNSDYQLWNFVGRFRARVKFLDSRCGPAENDSMVRHGWTEGPAKHKEAPLTLCDSVFLFNFSGNFHFTSLDEQSRSARLYNFCEADLARD